MSLRKSRLAIVLRPLKLCEFLSKCGHLVKLVCDVTAGGFKITYGGLAAALRVCVQLAWSAGSLTKDSRAMWITNLPVLRLVNTCTAL